MIRKLRFVGSGNILNIFCDIIRLRGGEKRRVRERERERIDREMEKTEQE